MSLHSEERYTFDVAVVVIFGVSYHIGPNYVSHVEKRSQNRFSIMEIPMLCEAYYVLVERGLYITLPYITMSSGGMIYCILVCHEERFQQPALLGYWKVIYSACTYSFNFTISRSVTLWVAIQSAGDWFSEMSQVWILVSAEEHNFSHFYSKWLPSASVQSKIRYTVTHYSLMTRLVCLYGSLFSWPCH